MPKLRKRRADATRHRAEQLQAMLTQAATQEQTVALMHRLDEVMNDQSFATCVMALAAKLGMTAARTFGPLNEAELSCVMTMVAKTWDARAEMADIAEPAGHA